MVGIPTPTAPGGSAPGGCPLPPEPRAFAVAERQGEPYWTADTVTVVKAAPAGTGGRLAVVEQLLVAGRPRAVRRNPDGDEVWYVLDGILDVVVGSVTYTAERGAVLFVPRGAGSTVRVLSQTARILLVLAPADEATLRRLVTA
jgi:mannose-6-phosphate isomerase-like protein (cupin superfamily)